MDITDIRISKVHSEGKLKAYVTVTFDDSFVVHNLKIIDGENGFFIAMPSRRTKSGVYKDVAHPVNTNFRVYLQEKILEAYILQEKNDTPSVSGDDDSSDKME